MAEPPADRFETSQFEISISTRLFSLIRTSSRVLTAGIDSPNDPMLTSLATSPPPVNAPATAMDRLSLSARL